MLKRYFSFLWPLGVFFLVIILIILTNHNPGTFLLGGDSLVPELNLGLNIKRSIFAVWQEYQGLGLLGGMGHVTDLLRQLILVLLSHFLPQSALRYAWVMIMLFVGTVGAYVLILYLLSRVYKKDAIRPSIQGIACIGGLFYLLNFSTVQSFYTPFEAFTSHFGMLPWLLYSALKYLELPIPSTNVIARNEETSNAAPLWKRKYSWSAIPLRSKPILARLLRSARNDEKALLFFSIILLLATPGFYVPTLFVVYILALSVIIGTFLFISITNPFGGNIKTEIAKYAKLYLFIFLINAFWILPFAYFTLTNSSVALTAKINQMATDSIFMRNKEYGDLLNVLLLRGFWLNNVDPNANGTSEYMFAAWRGFLANPIITFFGLFLVGLILIGIFFAIKKRHPLLLSFVSLLVFAILILATNTPPFSWIDNFLRAYVPLVKEVFRFPFTKFSLLAQLVFACFLAIGVAETVRLIKAPKIKHYFPYVVSGIIVLTVAPIFFGHFFYRKELLTIPPDYTQLMQFFEQQDPTTRIADFPQDVFWGWTYTNWNYDGSGFLWYGIQQPILDRTFDVWSAKDENYYWELAYAQSQKNPKAFTQILEKYQITWLMVDRNTFYPYDPKLDVFSPIQSLFAQIPRLHKVQTFGNIDVYQFDLPQQPTKYVSLIKNVPSVNSYHWSDNDVAYQTLGNYQTTNDNAVTYPFRSLFTGKSQSDVSFALQRKPGNILISNPLQTQGNKFLLHLPQMQATVVHTTFSTSLEAKGSLDVNVTYATPQLLINNQLVWQESTTQTVFRFPAKTQFPVTMTVNGATYQIDDQNKTLGDTLIHTPQDTIIDLHIGNHTEALSLASKMYTLPPIFYHPEVLALNAQETPKTVSLQIPDLASDIVDPATDPAKPHNCNQFRFGSMLTNTQHDSFQITGTNATPCVAYFARNMQYDNGYLITFTTSHQTGQALHFWLDNPVLRLAPLDTLLPTDTKPTQVTFVIGPIPQQGQGYGLHIDEDSYGNLTTTNTLGPITSYPIPYQFLTNMQMTTPMATQISTPVQASITVEHPNESLYGITIPKGVAMKNATIVLAQGYDAGWKLYQVPGINAFWGAFPFFAGSAYNTHVMVNNWENGWNLDNSGTGEQHYIIVYLPQYLEYIGFVVLFATFVWILWLHFSSPRGED